MKSKEETKKKFAYAKPVFPYYDVEKSMAVYPADLRYQMLDGIGSKTYSKKNMPRELMGHFPEYDVARWYAATAVIGMIRDRGISDNFVAEKTGISKTLISKMRSKERYFCAPSASWEALCYDVFDMSVHSLIFGEDCSIILPKKYAVPFGFLAEYADSLYIDMLLTYAENVYTDYRKGKQRDKFGHYKSASDLHHERIGDLRESAGYYNYHTFGCKENGAETPNIVKATLKSFWNDNRSFKYGLICYAAMYYRIAVDYITCEMPCRMNRVFASAHDNNIELSDELKRIVDYLLAVDSEGKQKIMSSIWGYIIAKIHANGSLFA